jgi:hypothetical protein
MRILLASIFNFVLFHCCLCINNKILGKQFFDLTIMGGATIIPRIFANNRFSKIISINSDRDGFMCQSRAKMSNFFPLSLKISGIEFSLV